MKTALLALALMAPLAAHAQPARLTAVLAQSAPGGGRIELAFAPAPTPPAIAYDRASRRLTLTFLPAPEGGPSAALTESALAPSWPSWTARPEATTAGDTLRLVFALTRPLVPGTAWRRGDGGRLTLVLFGVAPDTTRSANTRFYRLAPRPARRDTASADATDSAAADPATPARPDPAAVPRDTLPPAPVPPAPVAPAPEPPAAAPRDTVPLGFYTLDRSDEAEVIVLDAGHGGHDVGATANGIREKDVTLGVVLRLGRLLEAAGRRVVYTRTTDVFVPLQERGRRANAARGTLFVSVHVNATATGRAARGTETYLLGMHKTAAAEAVMQRENSVIRYEADRSAYTGLSGADYAVMALAGSAYQRTSERLAAHVEAQFRAQGRTSRGVKQAGFYVLWSASMPAVLVETGFVNDPAEARYLASDAGQDEMARALFRAIDATQER